MIVGCGGDETTGPLPGGGWEVASSIGGVVTIDEDSTLHIVIGSTSNLCTDMRANPPIDRQGESFIEIELADVGGANTTAPTAAGTYTIYPNTGSRPPKSASFVTGRFDSDCMLDDAADASGQSGTVVLTALGAKYTGTYDVVLNTGDHATGSFDAASCTELQTAVTNNQHVCMP
jgi:hypothetical protein